MIDTFQFPSYLFSSLDIIRMLLLKLKATEFVNAKPLEGPENGKTNMVVTN